MKKLMATLAIVLMASPAFAHSVPAPTPTPAINYADLNDSDGLAVGFGFDAPKLIQVTENNFIGAETWATDHRSKVFHQTMNENDVTALVKWSYFGTWLSFVGK